jgi:hypothetical protein
MPIVPGLSPNIRELAEPEPDLQDDADIVIESSDEDSDQFNTEIGRAHV